MLAALGTGFIISKDGYLLTNHHVVKDADQVKVQTPQGPLKAIRVAEDLDNDLALLKVEGEHTPVSFASDDDQRLGQTVFVLGHPNPELQGRSLKVTKGVISGLAGIQDDKRMYQIDAAVQPGNSGGPLIDEAGNVVGVVTAKLNPRNALLDEMPENVNYAVKNAYVLMFLAKYPTVQESIQKSLSLGGLSSSDAVQKVMRSTVLIEVYW
jgi:S1-C subfamily serine protease